MIERGNFYFVPIIHYTMEAACEVRRAFFRAKPDCIAVELPESMQEVFQLAAARLPDVGAVIAENEQEKLCFPIEPCDPSLEALRTAHEANIPSYCIDLDVIGYPRVEEELPDPYAITKIGLKSYYEAYAGCFRPNPALRGQKDIERELHMTKRLRELSFSHDKILVVIGMAHLQSILNHLDDSSYPTFQHAKRDSIQLVTYPEEKTRELLAECGWVSTHYEAWREEVQRKKQPLDRQKLYASLFKEARKAYQTESELVIHPHMLSQAFTFMRNWAALRDRLLPDLYQLITTAKSCVDHNFAYEVWKIATEYSFHKNVDSLEEVDLSLEDLWGRSKKLHFHLKRPSEKTKFQRRLDKERGKSILYPPNMFYICSYPPEDSVIENFGFFLKKKAQSVEQEDASKTIPFSTSLEEGIDVKETIRHWAERKLYVKAKGRPPGQVGSCVVIFDEEDMGKTKYPAQFTWLGEHDQESDMAFYATSMADDIVGPGIARCTFGGFMLSYPNRRLYDVWLDPDYNELEKKHEILLAASIDYSRKPVIVYVGKTAPSEKLKKYASIQGKKIFFLPISTFPKREIDKLKTFHILDGHQARKIADEYI